MLAVIAFADYAAAEQLMNALTQGLVSSRYRPEDISNRLICYPPRGPEVSDGDTIWLYGRQAYL